jgi:FkbM family methyltransferase
VPLRSWRFGPIEVLIVVFGVATLAFLYGGVRRQLRLEPFLSPNATDVQALHDLYGPERNSVGVEEWILRDFFGDTRDGVFLDVGANHYQRFSNTYYLETALGWSGLAIEPQERFAAGYAEHRPRTTFVPLFAASRENESVFLYVPTNNQMASSDRALASTGGGALSTVEARTTTLDAILTYYDVTRIDFMSMDIELAEPDALAGFTPERFELQLACVESHPDVRQQILDYFASHGFVVVGKYLRADARNLWFAPMGRVQ